ncbi:MAG: transcription antitermination protein NusB, partial [Bacillota bacterium]|nr:transcription antitermination protein NusB [Bacillota bacterium]
VHSRGWKLERINPVDRNLIRLALYEVRYVDDVPFEVALDEAVELAKAYGEDESYAFVNGILDNAKKFAEDASTEDKEDNAVREEAKES